MCLSYMRVSLSLPLARCMRIESRSDSVCFLSSHGQRVNLIRNYYSVRESSNISRNQSTTVEKQILYSVHETMKSESNSVCVSQCTRADSRQISNNTSAIRETNASDSGQQKDEREEESAERLTRRQNNVSMCIKCPLDCRTAHK